MLGITGLVAGLDNSWKSHPGGMGHWAAQAPNIIGPITLDFCVNSHIFQPFQNCTIFLIIFASNNRGEIMLFQLSAFLREIKMFD